MTTTHAPERFTALPDDHTLDAAVVALEEHGSSVEVADDLDAAREAVLARIPEGGAAVRERIYRDVESDIASGAGRGTPTLFIDGVVRLGGYDAATLMEALAG